MVQSLVLGAVVTDVVALVGVAACVAGLLIGVMGGGFVTDGELQLASTRRLLLKTAHESEREGRSLAAAR